MSILAKPNAFIAVVVLSLVVSWAASWSFRKQFSSVPLQREFCSDSLGALVGPPLPGVAKPEFERCILRDARLYLDIDFPYTKELATSFLTLLTATLVASITFSEKIIDLKAADNRARGLMLTCWVLLLAAILMCGVGLAFMTGGAGWASYYPYRDFRVFEDKAVTLLIGAGISFACALTALLIAGAISLFAGRRGSVPPADKLS